MKTSSVPTAYKLRAGRVPDPPYTMITDVALVYPAWIVMFPPPISWSKPLS
jgi:hypothetical protein